jgi:NTP pyrophosphatase (non-canonical NTP hydrolase)
MIIERGFKDESISELLMLLMEECGELARACRKHTKVKSSDNHQGQDLLEHELADVFLYLISISNYFKIDLEKAVRDKEEINKQRTWK